MEYDVAPEDRERSINCSQQKFYNAFKQHQHNSALLGQNMKTVTTPTNITEITAFQPIQYATNSSSKVTTTTATVTNHSMSAAATAASEQKFSSSIIMEAATTHINLIDDEEEKDPLALDSTLEQQSQLQDHITVKHTHSLRRHVPRIIVKPIPPEKKTPTTATATTAAAVLTTTTITSHSSISPSSRTSSSRRIQQQQQAKAAAAAAAAANAAALATSSSLPTATTLSTTAITQASTMREVLASIPGFSLKPRRRSSKKISTAAQIEQTKDGKIDLETPDSILASTNLRALLNKQTFSMLPPLYQYNLIQLLPSVDREAIEMERKQTNATTMPIEAIRLGTSNLNNEFFARACLEWRERLSEGEFTPENQVKLKTEAEREKNKLDPWKLKHFEPIWGEKAANRACSSNSSISSNKSSIDTCNIAITNSSSSGSGSVSGSGSGSCKSLGEQKLEFKLESKGALTATIVNANNNAFKIKESPALEIKQETKSIIECRLDQHQKATAEVMEVARPMTLPKQETDKIEMSASGKEYVCKEEEISTHLQNKNNDELKCDKQTEMYEKIDAVDQGCFVSSESGVETSIKREPPSVFDLLRMQGNLYEHEAKQQQKRGTKRSSDSISANVLVTAGTGNESDNNRQQLQQEDAEISDSYNMESKQLKIEISNQNVPKQSKSNFITCAAAVSSVAPTITTTNFQKASSSSSSAELELAEEVVGEETLSCNAIVPMQNTTFTQEILDSYAAVEQQLHLHFLQKQEQLKATAQQITTDAELESTATTTTKLQYFAQIQPTTTTTINQNIINNINSTCDSMKDAFNAVETIAAASSNQTIELQQIVAAVNESPPSGGEAVDLIEQNFADAENYVLQSGDASTDSGDTLNVQHTTATISGAGAGNKNNLNEGDFIFSSSLDHVIGSDDCDNLYDSNKAMLPTSISSATTSSSSSSSSSSTSSSPTTSSAVTTSDMQEIISAANSLSNTLFQAPQQLQQQQQQRQHQEDQPQPTLGCNIMSSSATSRHNEMFQHVQHDWNFGGLKLHHQTNDKYLNTTQDQSTTSQQQHILQPAAVEVQEDDDINDENEDDVNECVLSHSISNDVVQHIIEDEPEDDDDEMDDSDAVRDIVDELQQQHQQLLQEQQQEHLHQQLQVQEQQRQEQQQQFPVEQLEYSNEMSESLSSDVLCEVPMSAAEMEVTSTVVTNSNSNDDSSNELNLFNNSAASISNPAINHIQHMPPQPAQSQQQQRQILVDSNGQIIRNFLMQQQQLQQQQQLLQHAQQLAAFQTNQHHQAAVAVPQPPQQQQTPQQLIQHTQPQLQQQQQQHQPQKTATLSMQVIRRPYDSGTNGQQQLFQHAISAQPQQQQQQQQHSIEQSNQHQVQHFALQQQQQHQQQRNFLSPTTNAISQQASTSNNLMPSQQIQLQTAQHQQSQQHHHQQQHQHQQMPTFQTQAPQQPKFISKQLNIISLPRSSVNITSSSAATPSAATAYSYNTSPAISAALPTAATTAANNLITSQHHHQQQQQQHHAASNAIHTIKTLPSTPVGIPSTIAQQRLIMTKLPSGKGRKATNNKLPPGAVNLERSYQICQAVIQNSPNRESLKAQLRPPSAILGQQQSSGGSSPSSTSLSNSCSSASSSPSSSAMHVKNEDIIASSTTLPTGMPPNVMGVGRPNVYKVIGPRMGFPRKKYVQRQPSPTMIRHVYAAPPGTVNMSAANTQQLNVLQQQQQQHHAHHHPHIQLQAPPPQHELHQNGSGQYVLVHRANVGAADNQAPRASSAPPVPQNQHQFHGMNGIPITGRGRPASVDVDTSNTVHEIQQTIHGANPANIVRRNISAGNITYIDNYTATAPAALVDGSNYIVATAAAAQSTDNSGENTPPTTDSNNCACSLNAMVICQQCGAFCHDDCISATRLCVSCVIR